MTDHDDVLDLIRRWDRTGLLHDGQADVLRRDVEEHGTPTDEGDGPGDLFQAAISAGLEALGYVGAALVLGALAYLLDVPEWPRPVLTVLLAALAGAAAWAVSRWTPAEPGASSRLVTIVGTAGLACLVGAFTLVLEPLCPDRSCGWASERLAPLAIAGPGAAAAAWLWQRERNAVTHLWLGIGAASTLWMLGHAFVPVGADYRAAEVAGAAFLLPAAIAWIWATETNRITPAWIGTFGAAGVAVASLMILVDFNLLAANTDTQPVALLALGAAWVVAGVHWSRWRVTLVGAGCLLWSIPWLLTEVFDLSEETTALLMLPIGVAMLAYVVRRLTADRRTT